jgi:serine/threonine protein kinase
MSCRSHLNQ